MKKFISLTVSLSRGETDIYGREELVGRDLEEVLSNLEKSHLKEVGIYDVEFYEGWDVIEENEIGWVSCGEESVCLVVSEGHEFTLEQENWEDSVWDRFEEVININW